MENTKTVAIATHFNGPLALLKKVEKKTMMFIALVMTQVYSFAGTTATGSSELEDGVKEFNTQLATVWWPIFRTTVFILCALALLFGIFQVIQMNNRGDDGVMKRAGAWMGGLIFVLAAVWIIETLIIKPMGG